MNYYRISKDNWSVVSRFDTLEDAQAFADSLGTGYTVEYVKPYVPPTISERLSLDIEFCNQLILQFVYDNREMDITPEQSENVLIKFRDILAFAQTGAVLSIQTYLPLIPIDEVFTQERKDKYMLEINNYINSYN